MEVYPEPTLNCNTSGSGGAYRELEGSNENCHCKY